MTIQEAIAKLSEFGGELDLSVGNIVDILVGDRTNEVKIYDKPKRNTVITEADLEDFNPNDHLSEAEELYKQIEVRVAQLKKKDIAKSFEDLNLPAGELTDELEDTYKTVSCLDDNELVSLLTIYDDLLAVTEMAKGEVTEDWQLERLKFILAQKKLAFYA